MPNALSAQVVVRLSLDAENSKITYEIIKHDGECSGINQIADTLMTNILQAVPECAKPLGAKQ
jgi:hypothetical protein